MMASVFLMQPLGQIAAAAVGWGVLVSLVRSRGLDHLPSHGADLTEEQKKAILSTVDTIWRWVIGAGCIPAVFAILYRFAIPESPRYTVAMDNPKQAYFDALRHNKKKYNEEAVRIAETRVMQGRRPDEEAEKNTTASSSGNDVLRSGDAIGPDNSRRRKEIVQQNGYHGGNNVNNMRGNPVGDTRSGSSAVEQITFYQHFWTNGNIRYLAATSLCWFFLDFAFYALGINNPRQIGAIWDESLPIPESNATAYDWPTTLLIGLNNPILSNATIPDWQNPFHPGTNIYQELYRSAKEYILTISCGSLTGSVVLLLFVDYIPRKNWLVGSFIILAVLFAILGSFYATVEFTPRHWVTVTFYILCQFFFNVGESAYA
jgi:PHS family inorganic phosphate transporter-like MFS transporter